MRGITSGEARELLEAARRAGWRIRHDTTHWVVYPPDGTRPISVSGTQITTRGVRNLRARFAKSGLGWRGRTVP